jgi:thiamine-triphosphatase
MTNSRFEELSDAREIWRRVSEVIVTRGSEQNHFGLGPIASLSTLRKAWVADDEFKIVLDATDFGHTVGEIELEEKLELIAPTDMRMEELKQMKMAEMDRRIVEFMNRYSWAFLTGTPKGKLTAYFEQTNRRE